MKMTDEMRQMTGIFRVYLSLAILCLRRNKKSHPILFGIWITLALSFTQGCLIYPVKIDLPISQLI